MKKITELLLVFIFLSFSLSAQNAQDKEYILSKTNVEKLKQISENLFVEDLRFKKINLSHFKQKNRVYYLSGFDKYGQPVFDYDDNINAARSARVDKIWTGGSSLLNLDGKGIIIGHWEAGGLPLSNHQEIQRKTSPMEAGEITGHATHTATTMIGGGIDPNSRGFAPAARILSYVSNNDESELAGFASTGGILSNHSYSSGDPEGFVPGYGVYSENSAEWDDILYNAPYLTVCKSAGNDRNDDVNIDDQGYDLIYTIACSKNVITVGAVDDVLDYTEPMGVVQSEFSNWGPTDDWRIKPDITTNGVDVYSAYNTSVKSYKELSGTSMSTPVTTGTIALLQQYFHDLNGVYMKSATVKALLVCSADELGEHDGPDFQSGWGLLNAERAANIVSSDGFGSNIIESSLQNNELFEFEIKSDDVSALSITLAWTDPAGTPNDSFDCQTPILVNDLDLRLLSTDSIYLPWTFYPNIASNNFTEAASRGDNFRDNVEKIDISNLKAGTYTLAVSHKGMLESGFQDFSLIVSKLSNLQTTSIDVIIKKSFIYPNPSDGENVSILLGDQNHQNYEIRVFDLQGRLILKDVLVDKNMSLNLSGLANGVYFIELHSDKYFFKQKLFISK